MVSPREYYKSRHPNFFSDSVVKEVAELDRSLLEYHLSSLTGRSQEADFERFARRLCERMVCPNLLPTTGPTGGGDSKADSETYPVADRLTLQWYDGIGREASQERWAFAFSAKADWVPKVKSDVKKIVETDRRYTTAFFITNQSVPAKKRAVVEDELQKQFGIRVSIFDRTWILEKVFTGHAEDLAISELKVTALSKSQLYTGKGDTARIEELKAVEARIAAAIQTNSLSSTLVDDALEAADLCRSIERPRSEVEGCYGRADRLALKYGTFRQQVESAYQLAWTWCWWFEDYRAVISQYSVVEERAKNSDNVYDLERLLNLWTIISNWFHEGSQYAEEPDWLVCHTTVLRKGLECLAGDADRPNVFLQAKTHLLQIDLFEHMRAGSKTDDVFTGFREIVRNAEGLVGYPFEPLVEILTFVGQAVEDTPAYNSLLDMIVEAAARRDGEVRAARLLIARGEQLIEQGRPVKAIAMVGQALGRLYKHETRHEIVFALFLCAGAYERVGLLWAARATYLFGASIAVNDFWKYGSLSGGFAACVNALKWVELRLGRLPQLLAWHELDLVVRERLETSGINTPVSEEREAGFDAVLAHMLIRTPPARHVAISGLPDALDGLQLFTAASVLLFVLGHSKRLAEMADGPEKNADKFADLVWGFKADVSLPELQLYDSQPVFLSTNVLGCRVTAECCTAFQCAEVAEWIFAVLESFLATSGIVGAFAQEPLVTVEVILDERETEAISFSEEDRLGRPHFIVKCHAFEPYKASLDSLAVLQEQVWNVTVALSARMVQFRDVESDLTALFSNERVMDRAAAFTPTTGAIRNVLGNVPKFRLAQWVRPDAKVYHVDRVEPWTPSPPPSGAKTTGHPKPTFKAENKEVPTGLFDPNKISHDQMEMISPIRNRLWNDAAWSGCMYQWYPGQDFPPIMGLMFGGDEEAGQEIFSSWRADFGQADEARTLRLTIVRGIDRANPHAYRVVVGANIQGSDGDMRTFTMMSRLNRMDSTNPKSLNGFLERYKKYKVFFLVPAFLRDGKPEAAMDLRLGIYEINVRNAWEIGRHDPDVAGVDSEDDVIIPEGITNPPVSDLLTWKRSERL